MNHDPSEQPNLIPTRLIVVGLVQNAAGQVLLCKMPPDRGVFPGQWGLRGGGIEPGETAQVALQRELREELGIQITAIRPMFFSDGRIIKSFLGGDRREFYMVFLIFACRPVEGEIHLNAEFSECAWVDPASLGAYDLNSATRETLERARSNW